MREKNKKKDTTKYGEFIPTFYSWIGLDEQKEVVEKLEKITDNKRKN